MNRCTNCLLPSQVPGSDIDERGVCRYCRPLGENVLAPWEAGREQRLAHLNEIIGRCRSHPGQYQAMVALSGGKDSLGLLWRIVVQEKLRVLAFTTDANLTQAAWSNIRLSVEKLKVDHLIYRPPEEFYRRLFRYLLVNQEQRGAVYTLSYVYAPLFEGDVLTAATSRGIPAIFAGYSPGQPEPHRMVFRFAPEHISQVSWVPPHIRLAPEFSESDRSRFWDPAIWPKGTHFPDFVAPFHAWPYSQEDIMAEVARHGLVKLQRHANPIVSNSGLNWLMMYSDLKSFGYNPYAPEFAALIRNGQASRTYWRWAAPIVDHLIKWRLGPGRETTRALSWLNLNPNDLKVTLPRGAYDPW